MAYKMLYLARRAKNVAWEDWPKTWKSHAIFASQFPAMDGTIDWMRYTTRIEDPALGDLPVSKEHDGVSCAEAQDLNTFLGKGFTKEQRALIDQDELRVFDRLTPEFSFYAKETRVLDGEVGEAAVFRFLKRKDGVSREAFEAHLQGEYADVCKQIAGKIGAQRWSQNAHVTDPAVPPDFPFEVIDECWFPDIPTGAAALKNAGEMKKLTDSLAKVSDPARNITMFTRPTHRWPRAPKA